MRDNDLTGSLSQLGRCALESLDASDNSFSGPLPKPDPSGPHGPNPWRTLQAIHMSSNVLTGTLPDVEYGTVSEAGDFGSLAVLVGWRSASTHLC